MHGKVNIDSYEATADKHLQLFSNLTRGNSAPLCLMSQAVLSSRGQQAFSIEKTWLWLFSRRAFFIPSNKPSHPLPYTEKDIQTEKIIMLMRVAKQKKANSNRRV
ncbi:hypothetical protein DY000_02018618 [Brassica cretica]|uniref:Uncharacterized protein n=1 Tax=Brassica cretica TaxID=69181 RepID=A0ABQ7D099_BRACR|nr:hypothetical protein DY000_02018618 [Brassica cretica]